MVEAVPLTEVKAPLLRRREVAKDTLELTFDYSAKPLDFVAGQYVSLIASPGLGTDPPSDQRDFSIASSPETPEAVSVAYRDSDSPVKRWLRDLPLGTEVAFRGPAGSFILPDGTAPVAMVAGGIGVTPFRSMLSDPADRDRRIGLFCWNERKERRAYADELERLAATDGRSLTDVIGPFEPGPLSSWYRENPDCYWFVSGPSEMVWEVLAALEKLGVSKKRIRTEEFTGYEDRPES